MLIFLYGQDTFRSRAKLHALEGQYRRVHAQAHNMRVFDCTDDTQEVLQAELTSLSLFAEKKFFILKNPLGNEAVSSLVLAEQKRLRTTEDVLVFWQKEPFMKSNALYKFLKQYASCQEFAPLSVLALKRWAQEELRRRGCSVHPEALDALVQSTGNDLWLLSNEITKLSLFAGKEAVSLKTVQLLVPGALQSDIFLTIDAVSSSQKQKALDLISKHMRAGESPLYLLSMIAYQFRNLLEIKDCMQRKSSLASLSLHPFALKKGQAIASQVSLEQLKEMYRKIVAADQEMKTGVVSPGIGVSLLVAQL